MEHLKVKIDWKVIINTPSINYCKGGALLAIYLYLLFIIDIDTYWHVTVMWLHLSHQSKRHCHTCQIVDIRQCLLL